MTVDTENSLIKKLDKILELKGIDTSHISYFNEHLQAMRNDINDIKQKIDSHDKVINDVNELLPKIKAVVEIYNTASPLVRLSGKLIIGVPLLAGFIAGVIYIKDLFKN